MPKSSRWSRVPISIGRPNDADNRPSRRAKLAGEGPCSSAGWIAHSRLSVFDGDNVPLDFAVYDPRPEPLGDSVRGKVGCFAEPRGVARLDLVP